MLILVVAASLGLLALLLLEPVRQWAGRRRRRRRWDAYFKN
ncbi:hypothetical protein [Phenylobacterium sp.]|jgi:hypothetical protein